MLILGIDSSGKNGSIALVRFSDRVSETLQIAALEGGTFSAQLIPQIAAVLQKQGLSKSNLDGFAVVSGPGSFTGLRVGLAAVKALAEILGKPIAAISRLEALAHESNQTGTVIAALDAGRGEIFLGEYELGGDEAKFIREQLSTIQEFAGKKSAVVTSDQALAEKLRAAGVEVTVVPLQRAGVIAKLGFAKIQAGQVVSAGELDASYIRRSDAEIKFGVDGRK